MERDTFTPSGLYSDPFQAMDEVFLKVDALSNVDTDLRQSALPLRRREGRFREKIEMM